MTTAQSKESFIKAVADKDLATMLEIAVDDAESLQKAGNVKLEMNTWVGKVIQEKDGHWDSYCCVCLAGATMYRRFGIRDGKGASILFLILTGDAVAFQKGFEAINLMRMGYMMDAAWEVELMSQFDSQQTERTRTAAILDFEAKFKSNFRGGKKGHHYAIHGHAPWNVYREMSAEWRKLAAEHFAR